MFALATGGFGHTSATFNTGFQGKMVTLYRGVNKSGGSAYSNALKGIAKPRGGRFGHTNALKHNTGKNGTLNSALTSWSTNKDFALNYAYRGATKDGVLLKLRVSNTEIIKSANLHRIQLIHKKNLGLVSEAEKLLRRTVKGADAIKVKF